MQHLYDDIGHSIPDPDQKQAWINLVSSLISFVEEHGATEDILFHGTTSAKAKKILKGGMRPVLAFETLHDGTDTSSRGSFWGTARSAAWWAENTSGRRGGGTPVLIACPTSYLQTYTTLGVDIPTLDFPQPGLTMLDDLEVIERWPRGARKSWQDSLADLGSVTALHDDVLDLPDSFVVTEIESLERILQSTRFSS